MFDFRFPKDIDIEERSETSLDMLRKRLPLAAIIMLFFFVWIVGRLYVLQIIRGEDYADQAYNNRSRERFVAAPRGNIMDRYGRMIVTNRPSFNVTLTKEYSTDLDKLVWDLEDILEIPAAELSDKVHRYRAANYLPVPLKEDISYEKLAFLENHNHKFPGVNIEVQPVRVYHYGDLAANVIGYLGVISKKQLKKAKDYEYRGGDIVGRRGLERLRESDLRGKKGLRYSEVDHMGFERRMLGRELPLPGRDIQLTLDVELQQIAENYMHLGDKTGSVVAIEVNTGRVLAAVSSPSIHLADFVGSISSKDWKKYQTDPHKPLINRVVQAYYPPGSTFKMVTALAGLDKGVIDADTTFYCPGHYRLGRRVFRCWRRGGHGTVDLKKAISQSCDVYFYQVGQKVGIDAIGQYAKMLGLGVKTGVEMEGEKNGLVPTRAWMQKVRKAKWQEGDTLSVAIGQGAVLTTPLQIAVMTATIANGGKVYRPQLVEKVIAPDGEIQEHFSPQVLKETKGLDKYFRLIRDGMEEVVQGKRGTARIVRIDGLTIAGKTGTSQVISLAKGRKKRKDDEIPYNERDHAWFTCYAPADKPEIAVTVMVEHGSHGSSGAGPVARAVLQQYFRGRINRIEE